MVIPDTLMFEAYFRIRAWQSAEKLKISKEFFSQNFDHSFWNYPNFLSLLYIYILFILYLLHFHDPGKNMQACLLVDLLEQNRYIFVICW